MCLGARTPVLSEAEGYRSATSAVTTNAGGWPSLPRKGEARWRSAGAQSLKAPSCAAFEGEAHRDRRSVHAVADAPSSTSNLAITLGYFVGH